MRLISRSAEYASWQTRLVEIRGNQIHLCTKAGQAGFGETDYADQLLAEHAPISSGDVVMNLQCGSGLVGIVAARAAMAGQITLASSNLLDVEASRQSLRLEGLTSVDVRHSSGAGIVPNDSIDLVLARSPKGRLPIARTILVAWQALRVGGTLLLAGAGDDGIQSSLARVERLFGNLHVLAYRKGCRVGLATKTRGDQWPPDDFCEPGLHLESFHRFAARVGNREFVVCSRPGVFSWDGVDDGAAALIEAIRIEPGDQVLDLGCGTGIVGVAAGMSSGPDTVTFVDVDSDALASARESAAVNGIAGATVVPSDAVSKVADRRFDVVVANPPFHVGRSTEYDVATEFIRGAATVLGPCGRAYVVANRFLPYEAVVREAFGNVETVQVDRRYKVLLGRRGLSRR